MDLHVFPDGDALAQAVASLLAERLAEPGNVGFATGRTMVPVYSALRGLPRRQIKARAWMLDEYLGLTLDDPRRFSAFLEREVFLPLNYPREQICLPELDKYPATVAATSYEKILRQMGGIGTQLLGIGLNGHVGFNEPGSHKDSVTRVVGIDASTRYANFGTQVESPKEAITLGIGTILHSTELFLLATGQGKAEIIKRFVEEKPSEALPATLLRDHANLQVFLDRDAASLLK